jgi:tetratricopeptide (TPR) repeat protein
LEQLKKLAAASPDDPLSQYALGLEYLNQQSYGEAIAAFEEALRADAKYSAAYYHKARAEIRAGQAGAARSTLDAGIEVAKAGGDAKTAREMRELRETIS